MATYETFASVYDAIMDDSLYEKWTDFSLRHFPKDKKKLLELACGTGIQSIYFKQAGFDVTGIWQRNVAGRPVWTFPLSRAICWI